MMRKDLDYKPLLLVPLLALATLPLVGSPSTWLTLTVAGLAMGMIMGVYASGDVGLDLMCGALVAVCCAAVGEYASGSWLAMALIVMLDCGACLVPA